MLFYEELKQEPIFMGFDVKPDPGGNKSNDKKQPVGVDRKHGVSAADLDSRLGTYDQAKALQLSYIGLSLMRPVIVDNCQIVCVDFDWKRSPNLQPKPEQLRVMDCLMRMGAAYERSYSGYGCHIFVKVPVDKPVPRTVSLDDHCEIEIFCGAQSQRANILLTDNEAAGTLIEVDLVALFEELGIESVPSLSLRPIDTDNSFDQEVAKATFTQTDMDLLKSAMESLPPAKDYHEWYTVIGLALKSIKGAASGAFDVELAELWDQYSQKNTLQYDPASTMEKWNLKETNIRSTLGTIFWHATQNGWVRPRPTVTRLSDYVRDNKGRIEVTQQNLLLHLEQYQLRYDEFLASKMGVFDGVVRAVDDNDIVRIQLDAERAGFKRIPTAFVRENVDFDCSRNAFDSAIEWGNSLVWDKTPRCGTLLVHYFGASDTEYTRAASLYISSAMGGRLMDPGCKADAAIVLVGKQGAGKSTAIAALAPMEDTFVEINLSTRDTDLSRQLRGKLVGEIAELRGLHSREAEDIKAFMSRTFENWVPKYKEYETTFKRRLTFWGTSNEYEFLSDHTGNRRWLPVEIDSPNADLVKADRDQIWAEAIWIYKNHGILWEEVQKLAPVVHEQYTFVDPLTEELQLWINAQQHEDKLTIKKFWADVKYPIMMDTKHSRAVGRSFSALGYKPYSTTNNGVKVKAYKK